MDSMYIRVTRDLSTPDEVGIGHLVGKTFFGEWDTKEKAYRVNYLFKPYWIKQDECESAECAFCEEEAMEGSNVCVDCLNEGMEDKYLAIKNGMEEAV